MLKGLLSGVFWGGFVGAVVVMGASLNAPLPGPEAATDAVPARVALEPSAAEAPPVLPATDVTDLPAPTQSALVDMGTDPTVGPAPVTQDASAGDEAVPDAPVPAPAEEVATDTTAPVAEDAISPREQALAAQLAAEARVDDRAEDSAEDSAEASPEPAAEAPEGDIIALAPTPEADASEAEALPQDDTAPDPEPAAEPVQDTVAALDEAVPEPAPSDVRVGRLPSIGGDEGSVAVPSITPGAAAGGGALRRNALVVDLPAGVPLFSIILVDRSGSGLPLAEVAGFPEPLTIALDPAQPGAIEAAAGYEATGHEVLVMANSLPQNATPLEAAAALTELLAAMPSAVGVLMPPGSPFVRDATRAAELAAILAQSGHGLVLQPEGLDALGTAAAAANVPGAEVFRVLDDEDEGVPLMTRYLDRAAFQAARDGQVVVLGVVQEGTMAALGTWVDGRRAGEVAIAPVSAVMLRDDG